MITKNWNAKCRELFKAAPVVRRMGHTVFEDINCSPATTGNPQVGEEDNIVNILDAYNIVY